MTIRPLYDGIVVKRIEEMQQMQGRLHIPDSAPKHSGSSWQLQLRRASRHEFLQR
jgi:co-chaperonin GroES (HSP10)